MYVSQPCQSPKNLISFYSFDGGCGIYNEMEPDCLCVCIIDEGPCSGERDITCFYFLFNFLFGGGRREGGVGYHLSFFGVMSCLCWSTCAVSACEHEPFDCTVVFLPVCAGGAANQDARPRGLPCPSHEGTRSCYFFWGFHFRDLTRVYLFGNNKICDSVTGFWMCSLFNPNIKLHTGS